MKPKKNSRPAQTQQRFTACPPIAVIDIGSNSVRQVIYDGLSRAPSILFNEKVLCGLGRGVATTARLDDHAVERALAAIERFVTMGRQIGVKRSDTHLLATAAIRETKNGKAFVRRIEAICKSKVNVLSGHMEAEYAGLGVKSGFHLPKGIAGDLGGGSLELIVVNGVINAQSESGVTLPLGGLRLQEKSGDDLTIATRLTKKKLKRLQLEWPDDARVFYAVGGTWRSLARLHMAQAKYPLEVVHDYRVDAKKFIRFCRKIARNGTEGLKGIEDISKNRRILLPFGAVVLAAVLTRLGAREIAFSATGLREGYLYSLLDKHEQQKDGLLEAATELSARRARSPEYSGELAAWTKKAFKVFGIDETENEQRYRIASCYLADIAWRAQSDYRAQQGLGIISNAGFGGITHAGRAYLGIACYLRYRGLGQKVVMPPVGLLATPRFVERARVLAGLFRVHYLFSASICGVLPKLKLVKANERSYRFVLPKKLAHLAGERPTARIEQLAREVGCEITLEVAR